MSAAKEAAVQDTPTPLGGPSLQQERFLTQLSFLPLQGTCSGQVARFRCHVGCVTNAEVAANACAAHFRQQPAEDSPVGVRD